VENLEADPTVSTSTDAKFALPERAKRRTQETAKSRGQPKLGAGVVPTSYVEATDPTIFAKTYVPPPQGRKGSHTGKNRRRERKPRAEFVPNSVLPAIANPAESRQSSGLTGDSSSEDVLAAVEGVGIKTVVGREEAQKRDIDI
jgi:hypothetical protein